MKLVLDHNYAHHVECIVEEQKGGVSVIDLSHNKHAEFSSSPY